MAGPFFLTFLLLLFPFCLFISIAAQFNPTYPTCPSSELCGEISINYPFWKIADDQTPHCGYQGFGINCSTVNGTDHPMMKIGNNSYYVRQIIYDDRRVILVDDYVSPIEPVPLPVRNSCPTVRHNIDFHSLPLNFTEYNINLSFHFNCNGIPDFATEIPCLELDSGRRKSCVNVMSPETQDFDWSSYSCTEDVVKTVLNNSDLYAGTLGREYGLALSRGFELKWGSLEGCGKCEKSDGSCGYNNSTQESMCFCRDGRTTTDHCNKGNSKNWIWASIVAIIFLVFFPVGLLWYLKKRKARRQEEKRQKRDDENFLELMASESFKDATNLESDGRKGSDLMLFSFASIVAATADFASENKLGEGGFGPVYKGTFRDERKIAIKRLSRTSGQGLVEFKNELILIAKLQHTNLVRILGCCIHGEEKMLIYEYMPNKSLDFFIFDKRRKALLDWPKRWNIIEGIAQGLLYLHKYSRMRVIHRDLKVSNVLLDENMNPKISDFGMARIFKQNETEAITKRVVGTYGYMSPEYAMEGTFSVKSDVFSFGVLTLEIVSGRRNTSFAYLDKTVNLIGYAWELWQQGDALEFEDPTLADTCVVNQLLRTIHVALLCVQENALDRPEMSNVISMLTNDTMLLPTPKRPAFFIGASATIEGMSPDHSINKMTITEMEGR